MLLIIDLEATCWDKDKYPELREKQEKEMETIEIGGTLLSPSNESGKFELVVVDSFSTFIKPIRNLILSDYCRNLTSITQEDVNGAPEFSQALPVFVRAVERHLGGGSIQNIVWASWGNYDRNQLLRDCAYHKVEYPFGVHWNVKVAYSRNRGVKKGFGVWKALQQCDMEFEGVRHRGIDDTKNIARIVQKKLTEDYKRNIRGVISYK